MDSSCESSRSAFTTISANSGKCRSNPPKQSIRIVEFSNNKREDSIK